MDYLLLFMCVRILLCLNVHIYTGNVEKGSLLFDCQNISTIGYCLLQNKMSYSFNRL